MSDEISNLIDYKICFTRLRLGSAVLWTKKRVLLNDSNLFFFIPAIVIIDNNKMYYLISNTKITFSPNVLL